tara:strand:- start:2515 stop:2658 length:144 start_codon:yes stop_codon:yes gene_type:complete
MGKEEAKALNDTAYCDNFICTIGEWIAWHLITQVETALLDQESGTCL